MAETVKCPEQFVFGLDIGTRSIVGTVGYMDRSGFHVIAMEVKEHDTRAMIDGQVHDIGRVAEEIKLVKNALEIKIGRPLKNVCIAAAGRVLRTVTVRAELELDEERRVTDEDIYNLDFSGVELAHRQINGQESDVNFYCVGYTSVKYYVNDYEISNPEGHKAVKIAVDLLATFLPEDVVDGLYASVENAGLEVANLTLEPIAAMNVAIPEHYRLLNIALVDVGAGTSDICVTRDGSVVAYGMIPNAGDEISEIIAKHYLVDFAQAEKIKLAAKTSGRQIAFKDIMGTKLTVKTAEVLAVTAPVTEKIAGEVAAKITELNGGKPVSAVFVVGGGGKIPGFTATLAKKLKLPKERVALRGKEVLGGVEFAVDNVKKDPLFVTPVGICINYYHQKNNFIYVTVNGERIKLYDNSRLTVVDAVMQSGYPNEKLFPRRGEAISYTLNGSPRMIRGEAGEAAVITRNGKECSMNTAVEKNDYIDIEESTVGTRGSLTVGELPEYKSTIAFNINGKNIVCPKFAYVNGRLENSGYRICEGDSVIMENYYTVSQLFKFLDISLDTVYVSVNNGDADENTRVYENFTVRYAEKDSFALDEEIPDGGGRENAGGAKKSGSRKEVKKQEPLSDKEISVTVNGALVTMKGKAEYKLVDVLDFYPFDVSKMRGRELVTKLDGERAGFADKIHHGAVLEMFWEGEPIA
ncbi:MAG: rod shape-determining protein [Butyrivibrio sp.]|nr:rod shape-determining protein [Butyrivibrio sp.]